MNERQKNKKKATFFLLSGVTILIGVLDVYLTYLGTPDLGKEGNLLVYTFGLGLYQKITAITQRNPAPLSEEAMPGLISLNLLQERSWFPFHHLYRYSNQSLKRPAPESTTYLKQLTLF